jgi:hypothetical protein
MKKKENKSFLLTRVTHCVFQTHEWRFMIAVLPDNKKFLGSRGLNKNKRGPKKDGAAFVRDPPRRATGMDNTTLWN